MLPVAVFVYMYGIGMMNIYVGDLCVVPISGVSTSLRPL